MMPTLLAIRWKVLLMSENVFPASQRQSRNSEFRVLQQHLDDAARGR